MITIRLKSMTACISFFLMFIMAYTTAYADQRWAIEIGVDAEVDHITNLQWRVGNKSTFQYAPKPLAKSPVPFALYRDYMPEPKDIEFVWTTPDGIRHEVRQPIDVSKYSYDSLLFTVGKHDVRVYKILYTKRGDDSTLIMTIPSQSR